ncbi:MAG: UPF0149 family protein [Pseudomonadota bacterium]
MASFKDYLDEFAREGIDIHPSEIHGLLIGHLCALKADSSASKRATLYEAWLEWSPQESTVKLLEEDFKLAKEALEEYSDFDFRLLIPSDENPISERAEAIATWCSGFLSGFGEAGRFDNSDTDSAKNVREALQDLGQVASMTDDVPEGEENEADLYEIEEFVRVSTLLVFAESDVRATH